MSPFWVEMVKNGVIIRGSASFVAFMAEEIKKIKPHMIAYDTGTSRSTDKRFPNSWVRYIEFRNLESGE